jgi:outer membrane lipoprotein-sorting protein
LIGVCVLLPTLALGAETGGSAAVPNLTAAQIVERNVAARGGLAAWRGVKTMTWSGELEAGGNNRPTLAMPGPRAKGAMPPARPREQMQLPFVLEMKRPRMSRLEIKFNGQQAVQVYDGGHGWKVRPFLNRRDVESYTPDELKVAAGQSDLDGPLIDYAAKGTSVKLEGVEKIEGHDTYRLALTRRDKQVQHVWIDANTFLETKIEGAPRRLDGRYHQVWVLTRNYKSVSGIVIPTVMETTVQGVANTEKINIEKIDVNPKLADSRFAKPT